MAAGASVLATSLVVAAPLLLIDSDVVVLLAGDWLLGYYLIAAMVTMGIGWLFGLLSLLPQPDPAKSVSRLGAWIAGGVALLLVWAELAVGLFH